MFVRIAGLILGSVLCWTYMRSLQKHAKTQSGNARIIVVSSWLSFLCGRPLLDNRVYLPAMLFQLGSLLAGLAWLPVVLFGLDEQMLVYVGVGMFTASFIVLSIAQAEAVLANRRRE